MKRYRSIFATLSLGVMFLVFCFTGCTKTGEESTSKVPSTTETTNSGLPKLVDLGATKCIPCKKMAPILEELKIEYAGIFDVSFIDVWQPENKAIASSYGIEEIPTQIFLDADGKELWRHAGFIEKADILAKWKELGYDLQSKGKTQISNIKDDTDVVSTE